MLIRRIMGPALGLAALLAVSGFCYSPGARFLRTLVEARMGLTLLPNWLERPVAADAPVAYDYALRCPGRRLEVRYAVHPLRRLLAEYARNRPDSSRLTTNPNQLYEQAFRTVVLNAGAGNPANRDPAAMQATFTRPLSAFPLKVARTEFGADWSAVAPIEPGPAFGQGYQHCLLVGLHKNDAADAYVFYLYDDQRDLMDLVFNDPRRTVFHSLRFQ